MDQYLNFVLRFKWLLIALSAALLIATAPGVKRINVQSDYKAFLSTDYPPLLQLDEINTIFTDNQNLLVVVAPDSGKVFTPETIRLVQTLTEQFWLLPYVTRVDSLTNFQHTEVDEDDLVIESLFPEDQVISPELLQRGQRIAAREPALQDSLISNKLDITALVVTMEVPDGTKLSTANTEIVTAIKTLLITHREQQPNTKIFVSGASLGDYALTVYGKRDSAILIPAMLALMAFILLVMTRSLLATLAAAVVVIFTGAGTMGLLGWIGWTIDPASAVAPIVIMTLAIADSIHIIEGMQKGMRQGLEKHLAIANSLKDNFMPVLLTSLTTVLGVATFTFSEMASLQRLGITVGLGVTLAFALSITLLPALLSVLPIKTQALKSSANTSNPFYRISAFSSRHYRNITVIALLLSAAIASLATLNNFNDSITGMMKKSTPERQAVDFYEDHMSGVIQLDVAIFTDTDGGINNPEFLNTVDSFVMWLRDQDSTGHVTSITDTIKRLNQNMNGNNAQSYRIPPQQDLTAQYLLLYEMSLPYGLELNNQLDMDKSATRINFTIHNGTTQALVSNQNSVEAWFAANAPDLRTVVTGPAPIMGKVSYLSLIPNMMKGGIIAIIMVSIVLLVALRSVKLGFAAMLANIVPVSVGYGVWYLIDGEVNFIIAGVAGVCLGVVVDFAVHFLSKYRKGRLDDKSVEAAINYAFDKAGRPLLTTMIVLVSGFWLLTLSKITLNSGMGTLTGLIILLAMSFVFFVLPSLLFWLESDKQAPR